MSHCGAILTREYIGMYVAHLNNLRMGSNISDIIVNIYFRSVMLYNVTEPLLYRDTSVSVNTREDRNQERQMKQYGTIRNNPYSPQ